MQVTAQNMNEFVDSKVWWADYCKAAKIDDLEIKEIQKEILRFPSCSMLQIGTNYGWTAFNVLKHLNKVKGHLTTIDHARASKPKLQARNDQWIKHVADVIEEHDLGWIISYYVKGSNHFFKSEGLKKGVPKKHHVIFIDGDHNYRQVQKDLANSAEHLHTGGTIFVHDIRYSTYLKKHKKNGQRAFKEFEDRRFIKSVMDTKYQLGVLRSK